VDLLIISYVIEYKYKLRTNNHEGHVADLRARANTASAERKAQLLKDESQERSTCVSGFPMKETSATRAVAWCSGGMLDDPQKSDSTFLLE